MPVKLIKPIQTGFTALYLGKVSYLVIQSNSHHRASSVRHEPDAYHLLDVPTITSVLHLLFQSFFFLGRINETPNCGVFIMMGVLLFQSVFLAPLFFIFFSRLQACNSFSEW